jgi:hypothetical protein
MKPCKSASKTRENASASRLSSIEALCHIEQNSVTGRGRDGSEHPTDLAKGIDELFNRVELLLAPTTTYKVLLYFINLSSRKVMQNVLF